MDLLRVKNAVNDRLLSRYLIPILGRVRKLPPLDVGLGLLALAALLVTVELYQQKSGAESEIARLRSTSAPLTQPDATALSRYAVAWSQVLQAVVASMPGDVRLQDVGFTASGGSVQATVKGEAAQYDEVVGFAENLRSSPLFSKVTIASMAEAPVTNTATPTATARAALAPPVPTRLPDSTSTPITGTIFFPTMPVPTSTARSAAPTPLPNIPPGMPTLPPYVPPPSPTPNIFFFPTPAPFPTVPTPVVVTPTIVFPIFGTPTPTPASAGQFPTFATPTATASATPVVSNKNFALQSRTQTCDLSLIPSYSGDLIKGKVLDVDGSGLADVRVRVTSIHTDSPWSAETVTDGEGAFRFYLTKGNFKVEVVSGTSDVASELWTRSAQEQGACFWQIVFKKTTAATPVAAPTWTPTITLTPTTSPTVTSTPPSGTVLTGTATASNNSGDARLAIDGDTGTFWSANAQPYQYWQETFDAAYPVAGFTLVVAQTPDGNTTHVVRFYNSTGVEIAYSAVTLTGYTFDGQQISQTFPTPIAGVSTVRVETTAGPSFVAWREIRMFAGPIPTATATATPTPRTWQRAQPIGIGEIQSRGFSYAGDVDWAVFRTPWMNTERITDTIRAISGADIDTDLALYEGTGDSNFLAYSNDVCGKDPMIVAPLKPDTTYHLRISNKGPATSGTYTLTVRAGALTCEATASSAASAQGGPDPAAQQPADAIPPAGGTAAAQASSRFARLAAPLSDRPLLPPAGDLAAPAKPVTFSIILDVKMRGGP